ncbi:hypothetical protein ACR6C2_04730 [Streptomyces sp. INA 01156]
MAAVITSCHWPTTQLRPPSPGTPRGPRRISGAWMKMLSTTHSR